LTRPDPVGLYYLFDFVGFSINAVKYLITEERRPNNEIYDSHYY
jgi:hypothetical protein